MLGREDKVAVPVPGSVPRWLLSKASDWRWMVSVPPRAAPPHPPCRRPERYGLGVCARTAPWSQEKREKTHGQVGRGARTIPPGPPPVGIAQRLEAEPSRPAGPLPEGQEAQGEWTCSACQ